MRHPEDTWHLATLRATRDLTPTVREFEFVPESIPVPAWSPGSHLQLRVQVGTRQEIRHYSLTDPGAGDALRIAVKHLPPGQGGRGGSHYLWGLAPGARITLSAPANHFELDHRAPQVLLVAGGIGVTPLVAMARQLASRGADVAMRYAARSAQELAYAELLRAALGDRLQTLCSDAGRKLDFDAEFAGLRPGAQVYLCGPAPMMEAARRAWQRAGRPPADLRFETFGSSGRHAAQAFTVRLPRHGRDIEVPADRSLLDVLEAEGIEVLNECRRGECGLCALDVISHTGSIDHRDVFLSAEQKAEDKRLCACVSRAAGPGALLVLDTAWRATA
jgi:vanillate O-demethylase ferredoxin subunit